MTQLLLSVRDADEARIALAAGAALIDCKEPLHGALGRCSAEAVAAIAGEIAGCVPVSVACGEVGDAEGLDAGWLPPGVQYAKLGLAGSDEIPDWPRRWHRWADSLPAGVSPVAVIYVDAASGAPRPETILGLASSTHCAAVLIDTYDKTQGDLWRHVSPMRLARWLARIHDAGLMSVVGGSLRGESLARLGSLEPDYLAIRGAACYPDRTGRLSLDAALKLHSQVQMLGGLRHERPIAT